MDGERGEERGEEEDGGSSTFSRESEGKSSEKVRENHKKNPFLGFFSLKLEASVGEGPVGRCESFGEVEEGFSRILQEMQQG